MWQETKNGLYKQFEFPNFEQAYSFMKKVARAAETAQHHPRWTNDWNKVEIWLLSHDAGDIITEKDHRLAEQIDQLAESDSAIT